MKHHSILPVQYEMVIDGSYSFYIIHIKQAAGADFALYPNPATDRLFLSVGKNNQPLQITVFDKSGAPVLRQSADAGEPVSLVIGNFPADTYVVRVAASGITWSGWFLKL